MSKRRPIADFYHLDPQPDVDVFDGAGNSAPAAIDPDTGGWVDLSDQERPIELAFEPTHFEIVASRE